MTLAISTRSAEGTVAVGNVLARELRTGDVIGLRGGLGSGKTTLARGVIAALGGEDTVVSPSFVLIREYHGNTTVYHMDLYRLEHERELEKIGVPDYLGGEGIVLVEWCERLGALAPRDWLIIELAQGRDAAERWITFDARGPAWPERLRARWDEMSEAAAGASSGGGSSR